VVDPHEVPDDVLAVLIEHMPEGFQHARNHRDEWRNALYHALTRWERDRPPPVPAHEHHWQVLGVKNARVLGVALTTVLQACGNGCGGIQTTQLNGEWSLSEITTRIPGR
jgi:hypothetical protein